MYAVRMKEVWMWRVNDRRRSLVKTFQMLHNNGLKVIAFAAVYFLGCQV